MIIRHMTNRFWPLMSILTLTLAQAAFGQENNPNVTVTQRPKPDFDPLGIRAGAFLVSPQLKVSEVYNDNVALEEEDEKSDFITLIEPSIAIESDWSVHSLGLEVGSEVAIHANEGDEDYQDAFVTGNFQLDITRATNLTLTGETRKAHVERDDPEDVGDNELTDVYQYGGSASLQQQFNRIGLRGSVSAERSDFESDQNDQDNVEYDFALRTGYEVSPRFQVFAEGIYNIEDRIQNVDDDGFERDSDGFEVRLGTSVDITSLVFGEAFAGYRVQRFKDDNFGDETGVSFGIDLSWNPTLLTSFNLSGTRDFEATDEAGAASNFTTSVVLGVDHEVLRNLVLSADAFYEKDDFRGDDREEDAFGFGGGIEYLVNRNIVLDSAYSYSERDSNVDGESYTANVISVGVAFRL